MEQQQFRISFSVGTKLLLSVGGLLFILIVFLSSSAIFILTDDKQAYTFETKSMEAALSGKELATTIQHVLDTLRLSLASVDPGKPVTPSQEDTIRSVMSNQSDVALVSLAFLDETAGKWAPLVASANPRVLEAGALSIEQAQAAILIGPEWTRTLVADLAKTGMGFVNLSVQGVPLLGIVLADRSVTGNPLGTAVAIALVPLKHFGEELGGLNLTVATRSGWILFDTDPGALFAHRNIQEDPMFQSSLGNSFRSGTQAYTTGGNRYLASYAKPGYDLVVINRAEWRKAMRATYAIAEKFVLLGCMAIGAGIIFAIYFSRSLTAPIHRLYLAAQEVGNGNFNIAVEPKSNDELGSLTRSFNAMSLKIKELFKESVEKTILEKELDIAATVQQTLIPPAVYRNDKIQIFSHYQAASRCGGDWWGMFQVGEKLVFGVADATGHGFTSALITASARSCFSMLHKLAVDDPEFSFSPAQMLAYANRAIFEASQGNIMMTFFCGVIDFAERTITYANAAHNPPWLFKREGDKHRLYSLTSSGARLGEKPDLDPLKEATLPVDADDFLFFYTDGLIEGKGDGDEMFGKKRARAVIEQNIRRGPESVIQTLMEEFLKFHQWRELDDDITIGAAKFLGGSDGASSLNGGGTY